VLCHVVNVSDAPRTVRVQILGIATPFSDQTFTLGVGEHGWVDASTVKADVTCQFTVTNGTRADIREQISLAEYPFAHGNHRHPRGYGGQYSVVVVYAT
jgi:hypothetical protein